MEIRMETDKKSSLINSLICLFLIILMIFEIIVFFKKGTLLEQRGELFWVGVIAIPFFIINFLEFLKPSIILLINENGIQFTQGLRYFYSPWKNIVYFKDNSSLIKRSLWDYSPSINKKISVGFLNKENIIEKESILNNFFKSINCEIDIDINKTNYSLEEIMKILEEYAKKYNPNISILENTNNELMTYD